MTLRVPGQTELAEGLAAAGADGWLLYDFQGVNPVLGQVLGVGGMGSRRLFVYLPRSGEPIAIAHRIELQSVKGFPGRVIPFSRWEELHEALRGVVGGRTVAMEVAADDAVPYLDRVPFGVVQLVERLGGRVVPSAALVTRFASTWSADDLAGHVAAAEVLARVAQAALARAVVAGNTGLTESALQQEVVEALHADGLFFDHPPIVGFGPNAANPHYEPRPGQDRTLSHNEVVLLDLWGGPSEGSVYADQTWMGFSGARPPAEVTRVWETVRGARDAAIEFVQQGWSAGRPIRGFEVDRVTRRVIEAAGFGEAFVHRTGHSIDHRLHGSGPHLDDYETHDDRQFLAATGFSVEPGVYLTGQFGVRSEVNMYLTADEARVTPGTPQRDLIRAG